MLGHSKLVLINEEEKQNQGTKVIIDTYSGVALEKISFKNAAGGINLCSSDPGSSKFIVWKVENDSLMLQEHDLINTNNSPSRTYVFRNESVFPQVFLTEFDGNLVILLTTNKAVRRILFTKKSQVERRSKSRSMLASSYLLDAKVDMKSFNFNNSFPDRKVLSAAFWQHASLKSSFVICCSDQLMLKIQMGKDGSVDLAHKYTGGSSSLFEMFSKKAASYPLVSISISNVSGHNYIFGVDSSCKFHLMTLDGMNQLFKTDASQYLHVNHTLLTPPLDCSHSVKCRITNEGPLVGVMLQFECMNFFVLLRVEVLKDSADCLAAIQCNSGNKDDVLADFSFDDERVNILWSNPASGSLTVEKVNLRDRITSLSNKTISPPLPVESLEVAEHQDPSSVYLKYILSGVFSDSTLLTVTQQMQLRQNDATGENTEMVTSRLLVKKLIIDCVERELQANLPQYEIQHLEYRKALIEHWQLFYSMLFEQNRSEKAKKVLGLLHEVPLTFLAVVDTESLAFVMPVGSTETDVKEILDCAFLGNQLEEGYESSSDTCRLSLSKLMSFLEKLVVQNGCVDFIKSACMSSPEKDLEKIVKACVSTLKGSLPKSELLQLEKYVANCYGNNAIHLKSLFHRLMQYLDQISDFSEQEGTVKSELNLSLDSSCVRTFVASSRLLRSLVTQNCRAIIANSLKNYTVFAVAVFCFAEKCSQINAVRFAMKKATPALHSWLLLDWLSTSEVSNESLHSSISLTAAASALEGIEPGTPSVTPLSLFSSADETLVSDVTVSDDNERIGYKRGKSTNENSPKLSAFTFLVNYVQTNCDTVLTALIDSDSNGRHDAASKGHLIQDVSLRLLHNIKLDSNALGLFNVCKHILMYSSYLACSLVELDPNFVLQFCDIVLLQSTDLQDVLKLLLCYMQLSAHLNLGDRKKAIKFAEKLIMTSNEASFECLMKYRGVKTPSELKLHVLSLFEESKFYRDCLGLIKLIDIASCNEGGGAIQLKKFKCCLEVKDFEQSYYCLVTIKKQNPRVFKDFLQCWVQASCEEYENLARNPKKFSLFNSSCLDFQDEVIAILDQKARSNSPTCQVPYYQCLYRFYIAREMYRSAAIVMLDKAMAIQKQCSLSAGRSDIGTKGQIYLFQEEYKAWRACDMALRNCVEKDQLLMVPLFGYDAYTKEGNKNGILRDAEVWKLKDVSKMAAISQMKNELLKLGIPKLQSEVLINSQMSAEDILKKLTCHGLFNKAILMGQVCGLDLSGVFQFMTDFYCTGAKEQSSTKEEEQILGVWLNLNWLTTEGYLTNDHQLKLMHLIKYHLETSSLDDFVKAKQYHFVVLASLLKNQTSTFDWLIQKIKTWGEHMRLSRMYLKYGYLRLGYEVVAEFLRNQTGLLVAGRTGEILLGDAKLFSVLISELGKRKEKHFQEMRSEMKKLVEEYTSQMSCVTNV